MWILAALSGGERLAAYRLSAMLREDGGEDMSGGSWDYVYGKVKDSADRLRHSPDAIRRAFGDHLILCAKALHDIEWVDSSDMSDGDERPAIEAVLGVQARVLELEQLQRAIEVLIAQYQRLRAGQK